MTVRSIRDPETNSEFTPEKWMVGNTIVSFWDGLFSGAICLVLGSVGVSKISVASWTQNMLIDGSELTRTVLETIVFFLYE